MKIGFIFECGREGPDVKVCRHLVKQLDSNIEFVPLTLDNKPNLVEHCGVASMVLLKKCDRVVLVSIPVNK